MHAVRIEDFRLALEHNNYYCMPEKLINDYKKIFAKYVRGDSISILSFSWDSLRDIGIKANLVNNRTKNYYKVILPVELIEYFF